MTATGPAGGLPTVYSMARSASASTLSARCVEPSAATMPTGSPTRSTKSVMIRPRSVRLGFSLGTPTSGGRCGYSVTTGDRVTAARPTTTATRLVAPTDSPTPSDISLRLDRTLSGIQSCLTALVLLADGPHTENQWQIQSCHPAWRKIVD